ncbi:hypothetical protein ACFLXK_01510 [Chloroflexota bacterium]
MTNNLLSAQYMTTKGGTVVSDRLGRSASRSYTPDQGHRVCVVDGSPITVVATDACDRVGLLVPLFSPKLQMNLGISNAGACYGKYVWLPQTP